MSEPSAPKPDAHLRPFRLFMWAIYFVITITVSLLVTFSVFKSVGEMNPDRPAAARDLSVSECVVAGNALIDMLETQRQKYAEQPDPSEQFIPFRIEWLKVKRQLEADCRIDAPERKQLKGAFDHLEDLVDSYTTHAVQFGTQVTPQLKATRNALTAIK